MSKAAYTRSPQKEKPDSKPGRMVMLLSEARWLVLLAITAFLAMILLTYSTNDPAWSQSTQVDHIANWGGRLGAWGADLLLYVFGKSAWWWFLLLVISVVRSYKQLANMESWEPEHHYFGWWRGIGFGLLLCGSMGIEFLRMYSYQFHLPRAPGGVLGEVIGNAAYNIFGFTGATLFFLVLIGIGISVLFQVSWLAVAEKVGTALELSLDWILKKYAARQDRKVGQVAAIQREVVVVQERAKHVEAAPIRIEPQVVAVVRSERVEKEKQATLFSELSDNPLPPLALLDEAKAVQETVSVETLEFTSRLIEKKLSDFGVEVKVVAAYPGPVITRYEIDPATGVKGSQIVGLARDLARSLSITSIRVVETIPGKTYMGLELPNPKRQIVRLTEILGSQLYNDSTSSLTIALVKDIAGNPVVADLAKMPHLLVAGTTGSGKSVGINATLLSLLYKSDPKSVRMILIDPKMLEMSVYEGIPHLLAPVVTDMRQAGHALNWAVNEMERRYRLMSKLGVRNLAGYNHKIAEAAKLEKHIPNPFSLTPDAPEPLDELPTIVIIIDELADLMMVVGKKV